LDLSRAYKTNKENYGIIEGESFEFTVVEKPERPGFTEGMEFPSGMSMDEIDNLTQLRLKNFTLQPIFDNIPPKNSNFTIEIEKFPNNTHSGFINMTYNMTEHRFPINNSLGEPVITTDWAKWIQVLDRMKTLEYIYDKKIEEIHYELTNKTFKSTVIVKPEIPGSMRLYLTEMIINQTQCYITTTGIQAYMAIISSFCVRIFGSFTSVLFYRYLGDNGSENISVPSNQFDPLQIIIPLIGSSVLIIGSTITLIFFIKKIRKTPKRE
jgi:hypothetical protein